ncbi:MAG: bifunctional 5,10-methylene-tetrahydrofolate dehydrogenase/5,10-methylene-tetrahydrofolate cyclohydrolase [Clostridiales bacterium]|nr:bifunctional 5,10-methylene-tetrahydrofolate dehydrogenase/5,10-methylene-tetrahydrofolate cyclohydrolase [Clostridiales bacterium]
MGIILNGSEVAAEVRKNVTKMIGSLNGYIPHLAIMRFGHNIDDISYENGAKKLLSSLGIKVSSYVFASDITTSEFMKTFTQVNADPDTDAILLLRPLPEQLDEAAIQKTLNPIKDVDCFTPTNMAKLFAGDKSGFVHCTAKAVMKTLKHAGISLVGKRVTVVGRSMVVGKPVSMMLIKENATVTVCHTQTADLQKICRKSDIIIAAAGKAGLISAECVSDGAIVIDVGINADDNGKLCGDVDFDAVVGKTSIITPVPNGIGSITTSVLAEHTVRAAVMNQANSSIQA